MKQAKSGEPPVWFVLESSTQRIGSDPHRHQSAPSSRHFANKSTLCKSAECLPASVVTKKTYHWLTNYSIERLRSRYMSTLTGEMGEMGEIREIREKSSRNIRRLSSGFSKGQQTSIDTDGHVIAEIMTATS